jgi:hypothetical protein
MGGEKLQPQRRDVQALEASPNGSRLSVRNAKGRVTIDKYVVGLAKSDCGILHTAVIQIIRDLIDSWKR